MTDVSLLPKLEYLGEAFIPERRSYRITQPFGVRVANIEGGFSRSASDHMGGPAIVDVQYVLNSEQYQFFQDFYYGILLEGALSFAADLVIADSQLVTYAVKIIGPISNPVATGFTYTLRMRLEVDPAIDFALAQARAILVIALGLELDPLLQRIAKFATVDTVNSIGRIT